MENIDPLEISLAILVRVRKFVCLYRQSLHIYMVSNINVRA